MRKKAFQLLHDMEDSWWYQGRRVVVSKILSKFLLNKEQISILDFGAGYGGMFGLLNKYGNVDAFELDTEAGDLCSKRGYKNVFNSRNIALSEKNRFDLISLFDVVEHIENDKDLIGSLYKFLSKDGQVVITVPAYQWLWSNHDTEHNHYRRYTKRSITSLLKGAGFEIEYSSYWNTLLFLPAALVRIFGLSGKGSLKMPKFFNSVLYFIVLTESMLMPFLSYNFGLGIIVIVKKK